MKRCVSILLILLMLCVTCGHAAQLLEDGADGETVRVLTRRLAELGFIQAQMSEYGDAVTSAVGDFQTANGLERTGVADLETQQLMNSPTAVSRSEYLTAFVGRYAGKNIASGSTGDDVKRIQQALRELGFYDDEPDGRFGEGTRRAVLEYQQANGLERTGIADASMFLRLFEGESVSRQVYVRSQCAIKGDSGAHVRAIQNRLNELGYYTGDQTGTYGDNTTRAVSRFQYDNGLMQTGNVDIETYEALFDLDAAHAATSGVLLPGETGDSVFTMQQQLSALGFLDDTPDGVFGRNTETAVMLFCAANGYGITSSMDTEMLGLLYSGEANDITALEDSGVIMDELGHEMVAERAEQLVGIEFKTEVGLFPGFDFVRYVFAGCGVNVGEPSYAIERIAGIYDLNDQHMERGDVIVMGRETQDSMVLRFAVCVGNGQIVYVNSDTGIVEQAKYDEMAFSKAYVWKIGK